MTREEAINMLHGMRADNLNLDDLYTKDKYEALDMAIQALSQEPICDRDCEHCTWTECPIEPCDDAISREAAIKVTCNDCKYDCRYRETKEYCDCCGYIDRLRTLPSVTQKSGKWIKMPIGFKCSKCNELEDRTTKYCPNCGARMVEPQESEEV